MWARLRLFPLGVHGDLAATRWAPPASCSVGPRCCTALTRSPRRRSGTVCVDKDAVADAEGALRQGYAAEAGQGERVLGGPGRALPPGRALHSPAGSRADAAGPQAAGVTGRRSAGRSRAQRSREAEANDPAALDTGAGRKRASLPGDARAARQRPAPPGRAHTCQCPPRRAAPSWWPLPGEGARRPGQEPGEDRTATHFESSTEIDAGRRSVCNKIQRADTSHIH